NTFLDYGSSDLELGLASFISTEEVSAITNRIINRVRAQRLFIAFTLITLFLGIMLYMTRRIKRLTTNISDFTHNTLGDTGDVGVYGDELIILENTYLSLRDGIIESTNGLKEANRFLNTEVKERKRAEDDLKEKNIQLQEAHSIANIGSWEVDLASSKMTWSHEIFELFELDKERYEASYEIIKEYIHPDDRKIAERIYREAILEREPFNIFHRMLMKDESIKHVNVRCRIVYDEEGNAVKLLGTIQDITQIKEMESELQRRSRMFEAIFKSVPDAMTLTDVDRRIIMCNPGFTEILGYKSEDVLARLPEFLFERPEDFERMGRELYRVRAPKLSAPLIANYRKKDGTVFPG
ncbi:PAS domain S-box protein, partial [bacterium]|nr:PAS domain S-box protein [bacterium]